MGGEAQAVADGDGQNHGQPRDGDIGVVYERFPHIRVVDLDRLSGEGNPHWSEFRGSFSNWWDWG